MNMAFVIVVTSAVCFPLAALITLLVVVIQYLLASLAFPFSFHFIYEFPKFYHPQWDTLKDSYLSNYEYLILSGNFIVHCQQ